MLVMVLSADAPCLYSSVDSRILNRLSVAFEGTEMDRSLIELTIENVFIVPEISVKK